MPWTENDNFLCGCAMKKNESGTWIRRFLVLDFSGRVLKLYREDVEYKSESDRRAPIAEYDLAKLTIVRNSPNPPKMLKYCFEFTLSSRESHFFSADHSKDRDAWVEAFTRVARNQGFISTLETRTRVDTIASAHEHPKEAMRTTIVGGVVVKTTVQQERNKAIESATKPILVGGTETLNRPKVIKAGYAVKQGAVRKSWKRRFFILTEAAFAYYKDVEESEPLESIDTDKIMGVAQTREFKDRDFMLAVDTAGREFYLQCETEEDMTDWMKAFESLTLKAKPKGLLPDADDTEDLDGDSFESDDEQKENGGTEV